MQSPVNVEDQLFIGQRQELPMRRYSPEDPAKGSHRKGRSPAATPTCSQCAILGPSSGSHLKGSSVPSCYFSQEQ